MQSSVLSCHIDNSIYKQDRIAIRFHQSGVDSGVDGKLSWGGGDYDFSLGSTTILVVCMVSK